MNFHVASRGSPLTQVPGGHMNFHVASRGSPLT